MVEMKMLIPGLETYGCSPEGIHSCTAIIPDIFISETHPRIVELAYPYLVHCWLFDENISDAAVEACMWTVLDGNEDERIIASYSNTLVTFWNRYKVCLLNHFKAIAPPKIYRDIVAVQTNPRYPNLALWTVDTTLIDIVPYGTFSTEPPKVLEIGKYF